MNNSTKFHKIWWKCFWVIVWSVDNRWTDGQTTVYHNTSHLRQAHKNGCLVPIKYFIQAHANIYKRGQWFWSRNLYKKGGPMLLFATRFFGQIFIQTLKHKDGQTPEIILMDHPVSCTFKSGSILCIRPTCHKETFYYYRRHYYLINLLTEKVAVLNKQINVNEYWT